MCLKWTYICHGKLTLLRSREIVDANRTKIVCEERDVGECFREAHRRKCQQCQDYARK